MIYLDNNATTQPTKAVVEAMLPYLNDCYFNASASSAQFTGADKPQSLASSAMSKLLNAEEPRCFVFTSGASESNNWVLASLAKRKRRGRIVTSNIEHPSLSEPANEMTRLGFEVVQLPVDSEGVIPLDLLRDTLGEDTVFVSIIAANNETGVLQPVQEIGRLIRDKSPSAIFHTDATQAVGKVAVDLQSAWEEVDLLSFSAHKFHAPKGIGGLYIRPGIELAPMIFGGGQQQGLRAGTINTPALAGLATAARESCELSSRSIKELRDTFEIALQEIFPEVIIHSAHALRLPNTSYFSLPGIVAVEAVDMLSTAGIIVGTGAACSSGAIQPSKTLRAMGVGYEIASSALRASLSRFSTSDELSQLLEALRSIRRNVAFSLPDASANVESVTHSK